MSFSRHRARTNGDAMALIGNAPQFDLAAAGKAPPEPALTAPCIDHPRGSVQRQRHRLIRACFGRSDRSAQGFRPCSRCGSNRARRLLTLGSSSPASRGSGMLFTKLGSPASNCPVSTSAAVGAAAYAAPLRKCQRWKSDMGCPSVRRDGELQDHRTISSGLDPGPVGIEDPADQQEGRARGQQGPQEEPQVNPSGGRRGRRHRASPSIGSLPPP